MTDLSTGAAGQGTAADSIVVWDPFVRIFHWVVVLAFFVAYFSEGDLLTLHVWAGYTIGGLVILRIVWGFTGPAHARFSDFVYPPRVVLGYMADMVRRRSRRYLGHSPAGGAMVLVLLAGLLATVWTGMELYAVEENAGPLAAVTVPESAGESGFLIRDALGNGDSGGKMSEEEEFWEDLHEVLANLMLLLIIVHIVGVAAVSRAHGENLVRSMFTGRKRPADR